MTTSVIPSDITEINSEINELLELTPQSTERGRLFWLMKAALDHQNANASGEQAPFTLGNFTVQADTATAAQVSAPGGLAFSSINDRTIRLSYQNSGSLDISLVMSVLNSSGKLWRIGLFNTITDAAASYVATATTLAEGASGVITFATQTDVAESTFPVGATVQAFLIPEPSSGSSGGGSSIGGANALKVATLTYSSAFVAPGGNPPDGSFGFTNTFPQSLSDGDNMTLSLRDSGGDANADLTTLAFLYNNFGTAFAVSIVPEGEIPASGNTITQLASLTTTTATSFSFNFLASDFGRSAALTNDDDYDIYIVPVQPYSPGALLGSPIDAYRVTVSDNTPSTGSAYFNNTTLNNVSSIIINTGGDAFENAKVRSLNGDVIVVQVGAREHLFSVTNVQNTSSTLTTLTVSSLGGESTLLQNFATATISKF